MYGVNTAKTKTFIKLISKEVYYEAGIGFRNLQTAFRRGNY